MSQVRSIRLPLSRVAGCVVALSVSPPARPLLASFRAAAATVVSSRPGPAGRHGGSDAAPLGQSTAERTGCENMERQSFLRPAIGLRAGRESTPVSRRSSGGSGGRAARSGVSGNWCCHLRQFPAECRALLGPKTLTRVTAYMNEEQSNTPSKSSPSSTRNPIALRVIRFWVIRCPFANHKPKQYRKTDSSASQQINDATRI